MLSNLQTLAAAVLTNFNPLRDLEAFLEQGGVVLVVIMITTFALLLLIFERFYYFWKIAPKESQRTVQSWQARREHHSWYAKQIRRRLISIVRVRAEHNLIAIKTAIVIAPLLGLLGTVTGMIDVFDAMAFSGSGNTRAMAAGVSKATIPTMAGMVVALVGMLCTAKLQKSFNDSVEYVSTHMELAGAMHESDLGVKR